MQQSIDVGRTKNDDGAKIADCSSLAPYQSPLGDYSYYPTMLYKRRASSLPPPGRNNCAKTSCLPRRIERACDENERASTRGAFVVKSQGRCDPTSTPLLGRYRQNGTIQDETFVGSVVDGCVRSDRTVSGHLGLASSGSLRDSLKVVTAPHSGTERASKGQIFSSTELPTGRAEPKRQNTQQKRKMVSLCPPAVERGDVTNSPKVPPHVDKVKDEFPYTSQVCSDVHCIHSRQAILEYVNLQRELRECYAALQDRDAELDKMRLQLHLIHQEKADWESRFQTEVQELENRYAEGLAMERKEQTEWQQRMLLDQLETYKRDREDLVALREELEQERLNHVHTQNELDATKDMYFSLQKKLESLEGVSNFSVSLSTTKASPAKGHGEHSLLDAQSPVSTFTTPTPRRQPPLVPQSLGNEECTTRRNLSAFSSFGEKIPRAYQVSDESPADDQTFLGSVPGSSTIDVSDPSIAFSGVFHTNAGGSHFSLVGEMQRGDVVEGTVEERSLEFDRGKQHEAEERSEDDGRPSSCGTRGKTHTTVGVQTIEIVPDSFLPYGGNSITTELCKLAVGVQLPSIHPFERVTGHEGLLCKELLRALLDKEKQLAQLTSEQVMVREEGRNSALLSS